mmetsp:Transcript_26542/g.38056  ORF Transcript_26542/g.38056 Transcript_26542/m.38056 type:complete len:522 (+) Transcript_26542:150-1715(+)
MLVLFETSAGYSLFKVNDEKKLKKTSPEDIYDTFFSNASKTKSFLNLLSFQPFADTADAVSAASACIEGKVSKSLKSFIKKLTKKQHLGAESFAVADKALGLSIKESIPKFPCTVVQDAKTNELFRGVRQYLEELMEDVDKQQQVSASDLRAMQLGLSHSLSRYKLKFSADKVDTMVIQAVGLLDELDKEINIYAMRVKEWYGWHFPEMQKIVGDSAQYSRVVLACGFRTNIKDSDLSAIIEEEALEAALKEAAEVSMGTDITDMDIINIKSLAEQVLSMTEYRTQLFEYLKNRMNAIAPNLTILLGELVGARLISHAGSLMNLAKQPASTVQILGAEKALFRALKTKHDTPKYGLIYHASLIGQAQPKNKGKISRMLAAKSSLGIRVDALSDSATADTTIGYEGRAKVEARLRQLEGGASVSVFNKKGVLTAEKTATYDPIAAKSAATAPAYNASADVVLDEDKVSKKKKRSDDEQEEAGQEKVKKDKKKKRSSLENEDDDAKAAKKAKKEKKEKRKSKD